MQKKIIIDNTALSLSDSSILPSAEKKLNDYDFLSDESIAVEVSKAIEFVHGQCVQKVIEEPTLAIIKLLPNFPVNLWNEYAVSHNLENWLSIPINKDIEKTLAALLAFQESLSRQRYTDPLTGIGNRGYFNKHFKQEFIRAVRSKEHLTLIIFDLDKFKNVNDTYGHACGDMVLQEFAKMLTSSTRPYDYIARIGGEEFAVILPNTKASTGKDMGNRLRKKLSKLLFKWEDAEFHLTVSGGVASMNTTKSTTPDNLFQDADMALYQAKNSGRNRIVLANSEIIPSDHNTLVQAEEKLFLFKTNS